MEQTQEFRDNIAQEYSDNLTFKVAIKVDGNIKLIYWTFLKEIGEHRPIYIYLDYSEDEKFSIASTEYVIKDSENALETKVYYRVSRLGKYFLQDNINLFLEDRSVKLDVEFLWRDLKIEELLRKPENLGYELVTELDNTDKETISNFKCSSPFKSITSNELVLCEDIDYFEITTDICLLIIIKDRSNYFIGNSWGFKYGTFWVSNESIYSIRGQRVNSFGDEPILGDIKIPICIYKLIKKEDNNYFKPSNNFK